ncbi:MAG: hypothetical protein MJ152_00015 [Clostridia bacterium]|nr:hypothetical protein [Clostridia bacterium]
MKTKKLILIIAVSGSLGFVASVLTRRFFAKKSTNYQLFEEFKDYFMQTSGGIPLRTTIHDKNIDIVVPSSVGESTQQRIIKGINNFENLCDALNYNICFENEYTAKNKNRIEFKIVEDISGTAAGHTKLSADGTTGEIIYPIHIEIEKRFDDMSWKDGTDDRVLSAIVEHELGHTLGLKDLEDPSFISKSIMYGELSIKKSAHTYTKHDVQLIKYCYDGVVPDENDNVLYVANINHPTNNVMYVKQQKEDGYEL